MAQLRSQTPITESPLHQEAPRDQVSLLLLVTDRAERTWFNPPGAIAPLAFTLIEATTLAQALDLWRTGRASWAVLDLAWAEGSGLAFLSALGKCQPRPLPVVVLVGPGQERAALEAMKLGAADYLFTADFTPEALWARLGLKNQVELKVQQPIADTPNKACQHYQNLVENSPDMIGRFDRSLRHLYVSPALPKILGIDGAAFLGKSYRDLGLDDAMVNDWEAAAAVVLATGKKQSIEFTTPTATGVRHFEMAIAPEWSELGQIESLLCISRDISDRVVAQQTQQQLLTAAQAAQRDATAARDGLARVFDRINDGIIAFDRDSRCVYLNPSGEQILRRSALQILGNHVWDEFPEAVDTPIYEVYHRAIEQQQPEFLEYYFPPLDSWFEMRLYPDSNGTTIYFTDISDRKTAAASRQKTEQLRHELSLLETTLDSILAGYWDIDFAANTAYMSPGLKAMFGYADHELTTTPDTWQTLIFPEDLPLAIESLTHHIQSHAEVPFYNEVRYRHKDGSTVWIICAGQVIDWDAAGQPRRMVGCHVDITRLKHTEAQLRKNEAHLQAAQRIGNLGSWEFELATRHINWSDQVYRIFGLTVGEKTPSFEGLQGYFHPDDQAQHRQIIETTLATHQPYDSELRIVRADGSPGHIHVKGEAVINELGQLTHLTGTVQDISERKQHNAEMQNLSLRLSLALESARIGIWERVLSTDEVIWDQCLVDLYGFARLGRQATYQDWRTQVYADDIAWVEAATQALIDNNSPYDVAFRVWRGDGSLGWIHSSALVQRDAHGQPVSIVGINYDITDQRQATVELEDLSARLTLALESGSFGCWDWNVVTNAINWDQRLIELYDFDEERPTTYQDWRNRVHSDDVQLAEAALQAALEIGTPYDGEFRICRRDGELRWIKASALVYRTPEGQPLSMVGINYDITEKKRAETQLQELSLRLSLALESSQLGSWELDLMTEQVNWDQRMYAMYSLTPREPGLTLQDWRYRIYSEDRSWMDVEFARILEGNSPPTLEFRIDRGNGELRWIRATAVAQYDSNGRPVRMIGTNADITEAKQAEQHLLRTTVQLEASNHELEAFAYSVSHDLRAPLRAIDGFSRALVEDYGEQFGEEGQDYFNRIRHNVGRMGQLIDELLRLSRVSRQAMTYVPVDLSALVQEQIDELQRVDGARTAIVTIAPALTVTADPTLMRVAIANLVQNAWKFTAHQPNACIEFGFERQRGEPVYYLRDNGAGFDMAYADKLFGVFQRLHNTDEFPGTGIGLATVQRSLHRQGGRVWAVAAVDQGATFYFTLPQAPGVEVQP
ncbi:MULTISPECIES: PAS domain-containing protein [Cyanophyceae]|uniref:PAS domain-containing protein n=1 Tax=Cyanophyceae TaxID=3028117 RepID=UPI001686DD38|nr:MULTISPECIES: PAS domain-containing protein [Cyanophyceae]MBD1919282.1 PAS domain-containing protein [Phormidium sp. FACHB-77]MBD2033001.1 PAS domain-containing protein [Phormidium sp. FACHB-322]MBD2054189.1 PAS domain-containing protein [Leptolyngbya sp. FACHB-60]